MPETRAGSAAASTCVSPACAASRGDQVISPLEIQPPAAMRDQVPPGDPLDPLRPPVAVLGRAAERFLRASLHESRLMAVDRDERFSDPKRCAGVLRHRTDDRWVPRTV